MGNYHIPVQKLAANQMDAEVEDVEPQVSQYARAAHDQPQHASLLVLGVAPVLEEPLLAQAGSADHYLRHVDMYTSKSESSSLVLDSLSCAAPSRRS